MRLVLSHSLALGVLLAVSCGLLWGQGKPKRGTLNIEVVDPAGNPIGYADVRFSPPPEDAPNKLETATNGKLTINVKPGSYTLVVTCPGFKTTSTPITVRDTEETQAVSIRMQIGYIGSVMVETTTQLESPRNECAISQFLEPTRTVAGTYTEEATRNNAEGTVLLCATVDRHGIVLPPKDVVERLWRAATEGELLTPQGWRDASRLFTRPGPPPQSGVFIVMSNYYGINRASTIGDTAEIDVECSNLGQINSALRFTLSPPPATAKTSLRYRLVFAPTRLVTYGPAGEVLHESKGIPEWRIDDSQGLPFTTVNTAIRYVLETREKVKDPAIRRNADETIAKLLSLH